MILDEELGRAFRAKIVEEIFGADWRPDKPLDQIGTDLEAILNGHSVKDVGDYKLRVGKISGLRRALELFNETAKQVNDTP